MSGRSEAGARLATFRLHVDREDPLIVSCGTCGGVTQLCTDEELLPWRVIEHWLHVHWDRTGLEDERR